MPTYAQIKDTEKAGFVTLIANDIHLSGATPVIRKDIPKISIVAISICEKGADKYIEVTGQNNSSLYTCNLTGAYGHFPVADVNTVVPTDMDDLYAKLLALL